MINYKYIATTCRQIFADNTTTRCKERIIAKRNIRKAVFNSHTRNMKTRICDYKYLVELRRITQRIQRNQLKISAGMGIPCCNLQTAMLKTNKLGEFVDQKRQTGCIAGMGITCNSKHNSTAKRTMRDGLLGYKRNHQRAHKITNQRICKNTKRNELKTYTKFHPIQVTEYKHLASKHITTAISLDFKLMLNGLFIKNISIMIKNGIRFAVILLIIYSLGLVQAFSTQHSKLHSISPGTNYISYISDLHNDIYDHLPHSRQNHISDASDPYEEIYSHFSHTKQNLILHNPKHHKNLNNHLPHSKTIHNLDNPGLYKDIYDRSPNSAQDFNLHSPDLYEDTQKELQHTKMNHLKAHNRDKTTRYFDDVYTSLQPYLKEPNKPYLLDTICKMYSNNNIDKINGEDDDHTGIRNDIDYSIGVCKIIPGDNPFQRICDRENNIDKEAIKIASLTFINSITHSAIAANEISCQLGLYDQESGGCNRSYASFSKIIDPKSNICESDPLYNQSICTSNTHNNRYFLKPLLKCSMDDSNDSEASPLDYNLHLQLNPDYISKIYVPKLKLFSKEIEENANDPNISKIMKLNLDPIYDESPKANIIIKAELSKDSDVAQRKIIQKIDESIKFDARETAGKKTLVLSSNAKSHIKGCSNKNHDAIISNTYKIYEQMINEHIIKVEYAKVYERNPSVYKLEGDFKKLGFTLPIAAHELLQKANIKTNKRVHHEKTQAMIFKKSNDAETQHFKLLSAKTKKAEEYESKFKAERGDLIASEEAQDVHEQDKNKVVLKTSKHKHLNNLQQDEKPAIDNDSIQKPPSELENFVANTSPSFSSKLNPMLVGVIQDNVFNDKYNRELLKQASGQIICDTKNETCYSADNAPSSIDKFGSGAIYAKETSTVNNAEHAVMPDGQLFANLNSYITNDPSCSNKNILIPNAQETTELNFYTVNDPLSSIRKMIISNIQSVNTAIYNVAEDVSYVAFNTVTQNDHKNGCVDCQESIKQTCNTDNLISPPEGLKTPAFINGWTFDILYDTAIMNPRIIVNNECTKVNFSSLDLEILIRPDIQSKIDECCLAGHTFYKKTNGTTLNAHQTIKSVIVPKPDNSICSIDKTTDTSEHIEKSKEIHETVVSPYNSAIFLCSNNYSKPVSTDYTACFIKNVNEPDEQIYNKMLSLSNGAKSCARDDNLFDCNQMINGINIRDGIQYANDKNNVNISYNIKTGPIIQIPATRTDIQIQNNVTGDQIITPNDQVMVAINQPYKHDANSPVIQNIRQGDQITPIIYPPYKSDETVTDDQMIRAIKLITRSDYPQHKPINALFDDQIPDRKTLDNSSNYTQADEYYMYLKDQVTGNQIRDITKISDIHQTLVNELGPKAKILELGGLMRAGTNISEGIDEYVLAREAGQNDMIIYNADQHARNITANTRVNRIVVPIIANKEQELAKTNRSELTPRKIEHANKIEDLIAMASQSKQVDDDYNSDSKTYRQILEIGPDNAYICYF